MERIVEFDLSLGNEWIRLENTWYVIEDRN